MGCFYGMSFKLAQRFGALVDEKSHHHKIMSKTPGEDRVSTRMAEKVCTLNATARCKWHDEFNIHDHPYCGCGPGDKNFTSNTIGVHQLKAYSLWKSTLEYFFDANTTKKILEGIAVKHFPGLTYSTCHQIVE